ncbi:MAG TPA: DNA translocase FtsK 4TM domain-containing protein, partial [Acidimicrobiia bacterium]|nr:DNA translocase FtsK 4TM domain-containing protein [Acidimicrobiia bacterium]
MSSPQKKKPQKGTFRQKLATSRDYVRNTLGRQTDDVWGLALIVLAVLIVLAFVDKAGPVGEGIESGSLFLFGVWRFAVPAALAGVGLALIVGKPREGARRLVVGSIATFVGSLALFHLLTGAVALMPNVELVKQRGGAVGALLAFPLRRVVGHWGAFVVLASVMAMGVLVATQTSVRELFLGVSETFKSARRLAANTAIGAQTPRLAHVSTGPVATATPPRGRHERPKRSRAKPEKPAEKALAAPAKSAPPPVVDLTSTGYKLPPLRLLDAGTGGEVNRRSLEETAHQLEETLLQHGVDATLTKIVPGPTVTRYEIELAPGVKVNRVSSLSHDIAYALATPDVRILVPIPGKSAIGVEVPNNKRRLVSLGDILSSPEAAIPAHPLTVGLGMDISGDSRMLNLSELPHVLIAGATGAGKSSCINSIVTSL